MSIPSNILPIPDKVPDYDSDDSIPDSMHPLVSSSESDDQGLPDCPSSENGSEDDATTSSEDSNSENSENDLYDIALCLLRYDVETRNRRGDYSLTLTALRTLRTALRQLRLQIRSHLDHAEFSEQKQEDDAITSFKDSATHSTYDAETSQERHHTESAEPIAFIENKRPTLSLIDDITNGVECCVQNVQYVLNSIPVDRRDYDCIEKTFILPVDDCLLMRNLLECINRFLDVFRFTNQQENNK